MFQFTQFPLPVLCVHTGVTPHDGCRVSPFGHPRIDAWSTAPRGFSQSPTSFIGSRRQGIHRWLFVAWKNKDARARSAVLKGPLASRRSGGAHPKVDATAPSQRKRGLQGSSRCTRVGAEASTTRAPRDELTSAPTGICLGYADLLADDARNSSLERR